jgi:hypothetical protein
MIMLVEEAYLPLKIRRNTEKRGQLSTAQKAENKFVMNYSPKLCEIKFCFYIC